jgi:hypothetical protein
MSEIITYVPELSTQVLKMPAVHTAWNGLEHVLPSIVERWCKAREQALEFGVWYGFSTAALAQCFANVIGVDTFEGDDDAGRPSDLAEGALKALAPYTNVSLVQCAAVGFANSTVHSRVDLIHIDISHDYKSTYELGQWACKASDVLLFHDTESFTTVRQAVSDLADETGRTFYNYPYCHGLGILVNQ